MNSLDLNTLYDIQNLTQVAQYEYPNIYLEQALLLLDTLINNVELSSIEHDGDNENDIPSNC